MIERFEVGIRERGRGRGGHSLGDIRVGSTGGCVAFAKRFNDVLLRPIFLPKSPISHY